MSIGHDRGSDAIDGHDDMPFNRAPADHHAWAPNEAGYRPRPGRASGASGSARVPVSGAPTSSVPTSPAPAGPTKATAKARVRPPGSGTRAQAAVPVSPPPAQSAPPSPNDLIPGPNETTLLPQVPAPGDVAPAPAESESAPRKRRSIRRHRGETSALPVNDVVRKIIRGAGELLLTFGVIVLMFAAYEIWGVSAQINAAQDDMSAELEAMWDEPDEDDEDPSTIELGDAFARLYIPEARGGSLVLVEGTEPADIANAPGRYEDGAMPGEQGNFVLAGHNVPAIFSEIRSLEPGDFAVVETEESWFIYEVTDHYVVDDSGVEILEPVPREPGVEPGEDDYWMTLFTCHPRWDNSERYVVNAQLVRSEPREVGGEIPPEAFG